MFLSVLLSVLSSVLCIKSNFFQFLKGIKKAPVMGHTAIVFLGLFTALQPHIAQS